MSLITLNAGSSSLKFAVFDEAGRERRLTGHVDAVGESARLTLKRPGGADETRDLARGGDHAGSLAAALEIAAGACADPVRVCGHRIVHGGTDFAAPVILDRAAEERLAALSPLAPLHQPHNLAGVSAARAAFPGALQIACFDTAFHRSHGYERDAFALPRRFYEAGVRRYGFHGLSYEYLTGALARLAPGDAPRRSVLAHLGAGASLCAVLDGRSADTSMGFSALDGLPMATRCGQIDPGVLLHLMRTQDYDADALEALLYHESGLKGLSGLSGDMRDLEASQTPGAREAIDCFVFRCQRETAAMTASLEGLDALVFSAGMGENSPMIRERICAGLSWLGVEIDAPANARAPRGEAARISTPDSPVQVWVIPTDEEAMIARHAAALTGQGA